MYSRAPCCVLFILICGSPRPLSVLYHDPPVPSFGEPVRVVVRREEGAVYVDAVKYRGSSDACAAVVVVGASTASGLEKVHQAEGVAITLAVSDPGCTTVLCGTAVKNYAKGRVCSEAARILRKVEYIGRKSNAVIKWFPAHMGSDVLERGNANHNETANAATRRLSNRAAANTADSECWSRCSAKDKMTTFNEIVKWYKLNRLCRHLTRGLPGRRQGCNEDQETQLKAVQQVSAALETQRPRETEEKGGGTPRKGAAALSDPRK
ncbi:hypothetical protein HPB49_017553 [Dermacentor silvarum]|uniref:Uncharacterized protein n=1 Tax=Dermacentor silvarum TaxID=543639 RepID=A0ACB8CSG5_DERSI|nr:hypothetical protein HPB49_017553 [Dermacentor silvarum]